MKVVLENDVVNDQPVLRAGLLARVWMPVGKTGEATVVPKDALVLGGTKTFVYAVEPASGGAVGADRTGTVRPVEVTLGVAVGSHVEARGTISPGQLVVVRGNERLRPGAAVSFPSP